MAEAAKKEVKPSEAQLKKGKEILLAVGKYKPSKTVKFKARSGLRHYKSGVTYDVQERQAAAFVEYGYGEIVK